MVKPEDGLKPKVSPLPGSLPKLLLWEFRSFPSPLAGHRSPGERNPWGGHGAQCPSRALRPEQCPADVTGSEELPPRAQPASGVGMRRGGARPGIGGRLAGDGWGSHLTRAVRDGPLSGRRAGTLRKDGADP